MVHLVKRALRPVMPAALFPAAAYWYQYLAGAQEPEIRLLKRWIKPDSRAIDVGANNGNYSYAMVRAGATVEAFEPYPACVSRLNAYAAKHHGRFAVHPVALSDKAGQATLFVPIGTKGHPTSGLASLTPVPAATAIAIRTVPLDQFAFADVSFIKIDVEGHESAVLRGAELTLKRNRPVLQIEIEVRHGGNVADVARYLEQLAGYSGWFVTRGDLIPISQLMPGINNFIFLPATGQA